MSRERSPERKRAFKIWIDSRRQKKPKEIADELGHKDSAIVRKWKSEDKWDDKPDPRPGAPRGNRNAKGNKGGSGGPVGNEKAVTHGLFRKILPDDPEYLAIFDATEEMSRLDMLWYNIRIAWTNIMRSQKIQYVTDKSEMVKELKKEKFEVRSKGRGDEKTFHSIPIETEYEYQFAWDVQATALKSQAAAMTNVARMIKQYEELLREAPPDDVHDKRRLELEKLKAEVAVLKKETLPDPVVFKDDLHE